MQYGSRMTYEFFIFSTLWIKCDLLFSHKQVYCFLWINYIIFVPRRFIHLCLMRFNFRVRHFLHILRGIISTKCVYFNNSCSIVCVFQLQKDSQFGINADWRKPRVYINCVPWTKVNPCIVRILVIYFISYLCGYTLYQSHSVKSMYFEE